MARIGRTLIVALALWGAGAGSAQAAVRAVSNGSESCKKATAYYTTIQAAVDAANPGDSVVVCPGTYFEQVTISKDRIKLEANVNGAVRIIAPEVMREATHNPALVHVDGADDVLVRGFVLDGLRTANDLEYGILVDNDATGAQIRFNRVKGVRGDGCCNSIAIEFGRYDTRMTSGSGIVQDNEVQGALSVGIFAISPGSVMAATRNRISDPLPLNMGDIVNTSGIAAADLAKVAIAGNEVDDHLNGVELNNADPGSSVTSNVFSHGIYGMFIADTRRVTIRKNLALDSVNDGFLVRGNSSDNTFFENRAYGSGKFGELDCVDETKGSRTAGTANTWTRNTGAIASPSEICN